MANAWRQHTRRRSKGGSRSGEGEQHGQYEPRGSFTEIHSESPWVLNSRRRVSVDSDAVPN